MVRSTLYHLSNRGIIRPQRTDFLTTLFKSLTTVVGRKFRHFIWGMYVWVRTDKRVAENHERGGENFWSFCFETVNFGATVTNAVHHHWFSWGGGLQ